jgi:hypothetical protein
VIAIAQVQHSEEVEGERWDALHRWRGDEAKVSLQRSGIMSQSGLKPRER